MSTGTTGRAEEDEEHDQRSPHEDERRSPGPRAGEQSAYVVTVICPRALILLHRLDPHVHEPGDQLDLGPGVTRGLEVVRKLPPFPSAIGIRSWSARWEPTGTSASSQLRASPGGSRRHLLGPEALLPEPGEDLGHVLARHPQLEDVAGPRAVGDGPGLELGLRPPERPPGGLDLPLRDAEREVRDERHRPTLDDLPALVELEGAEPQVPMIGAGLDPDPEPAPARRVEAVALDLDREPSAHPREERSEGLPEEASGGRGRVVGPALDHELRRLPRCEEPREHGLEDQRRAPGAPDREPVLAPPGTTGPEGERARAELVALDPGVPDRGGGADAGQVLAEKAGARAAGPDRLDPERLTGREGQAQRGPEHLPAALALRSVDVDHVRLLIGRGSTPPLIWSDLSTNPGSMAVLPGGWISVVWAGGGSCDRSGRRTRRGSFDDESL